MQSHSSIGPAAFSPDGNEVFFFEIKDGETAKLIKISLAGTHRSVVAELPEGTEVRGMSWSPDGTKLAFDYTTPPSASGQIKSALSVLENGGVRDVYSYVNDVSSARVASGEPQQIVIPSWLSDKEVVFNALAPIGPPPRYFVMSVNIAGQDGALRQLWELPPYAACAHVSPDGKWLIYHQRMNVFLRSLSDGRIIKVGEGIIGGGSPWLGQLPNPSILVSREVELYERPADAPRGVAYRAPFVITMNWGG
jgi:Tol biopolymer transport system component